MGLKPTQYRSAAEALLRRLRQHGELPAINPLVDLGNAVSVATALPIAVLDLTKICGALQVRPADGDERYDTFRGDVEHPEAGEIIFADDARRAHARRWTNRQSAYSAVGPTSRDVLFVIEAQHPGSRLGGARPAGRAAPGAHPAGPGSGGRPDDHQLDRGDPGEVGVRTDEELDANAWDAEEAIRDAAAELSVVGQSLYAAQVPLAGRHGGPSWTTRVACWPPRSPVRGWWYRAASPPQDLPDSVLAAVPGQPADSSSSWTWPSACSASSFLTSACTFSMSMSLTWVISCWS